jgi:hypothetical protein
LNGVKLFAVVVKKRREPIECDKKKARFGLDFKKD